MGLATCIPSTLPTSRRARIENPVSSVEEEATVSFARPEVLSKSLDIESMAAWFVERIASRPATPRMIPKALNRKRNERERMERNVRSRVRRMSRLQFFHGPHDTSQSFRKRGVSRWLVVLNDQPVAQENDAIRIRRSFRVVRDHDHGLL